MPLENDEGDSQLTGSTFSGNPSTVGGVYYGSGNVGALPAYVKAFQVDPSGSLYITTSGSLPVSIQGAINVSTATTGSAGLAVGNAPYAPLYVSQQGQIGVDNFPAVQAISGNVGAVIQNWPAVIGVSGSTALRVWDGGVNGVSASAQLPVFSTGPVGVTASVTLPVAQQGQVSVNNFPATQNVSGTVTAIIGNWPATLGVTASATLPVQGVVGGVPLQIWSEGNIGVSGTFTLGSQVSVNNFPATQNVSGSVFVSTTGSLPVTGSVFATPPADVVTAGTLASGQTAVIPLIYGWSSISWEILGNFTGTIFFEKSLNGTSWFTASLYDSSASNAVNFTTTNGEYYGSVGSTEFQRLRAGSPFTGTANWTAARSAGVKGVGIIDALPAGTNLIGAVNVTTTGSAGIGVGNAPYDPLWVTTTGSLPVTIAAGQVVAQLQGYSYSSYSPDPSSYPTTNQTPITIDAVGRLETHSTTTSDEGSFRDDFTGTSLPVALAGTVTFTNGSITVTGTGTAFTTALIVGDWIKKTADAETLYAQVAAINSDTQLTLTNGYTGTTATTTGVVSHWQTVTAATGGSITAAASIASLTVGTTTGQSTYITRVGDYLPYTLSVYCAVSQRIANQTAFVGFRDQFASPNFRCEVQFTGTSNTTVQFVVSGGPLAGDTYTSPAITIPNGGTTAGYHLYKLDLSGNQASFSIDGISIPLATNNVHLPGPYAGLNIYAGITNTGTPASATTLTIDSIYFYNTDRVQIDDDFGVEPLSTFVADYNTAGTLGALNATVQMPINGASSAYALIGGVFVGTVQFQASIDGVTYVPVSAVQGGPANAYTTAGFTTTGGCRFALPAAFKFLQAKMTAYTSGTATVVINASAGTANTETIQFNAANLLASVGGLGAAAAATVGNPVLVAGSDGTNAQTLRTGPVANSIQSLQIQNAENERPTYAVDLSNYGPLAGAPTDVFTIYGSATKTIRVTRVTITLTATTAVTVPIQLIKRSTTNTGGTAGVAVATPYDSNNAAATATATAYTGNPTALGTVVGTAVRAARYFAEITATVSTSPAQMIDWEFGLNNCQPIVLRGTTQGLCVNLGGTTIAGGRIDVTIEWTEDSN